MKRLSIVIPMYNVAPYVGRCIRSLEDQDIPKDDYEIICVNDGSPDNCREIVEGLQKEYPNIILINQENQGVSIARNIGIDRATGNYLLFIDPDDYVDARSFSRILKNAENRKVQVSFLGYSFLNVEGNIQKTVINEEEKGKIFLGPDIYSLARGDGRTDPDRMVAILFERDFMNKRKLRYLPDVPYLEDGELIARIMCFAERCMFDGYSFYQRTIRPGSATNSNLFQSNKSLNGFVKAAMNLKRLQNSNLLNNRQILFLDRPIAKFVHLSLNHYIIKLDFFGYMKLRNLFCKNKVIPLNLNPLRSFYYKKANAINKSFFSFGFLLSNYLLDSFKERIHLLRKQ